MRMTLFLHRQPCCILVYEPDLIIFHPAKNSPSDYTTETALTDRKQVRVKQFHILFYS